MRSIVTLIDAFESIHFFIQLVIKELFDTILIKMAHSTSHKFLSNVEEAETPYPQVADVI